MSSKQKSIIFWIIFIVLVIGIELLIYPRYGALSRQLRVVQMQNLAATLTSASAVNYTQRKFNPTSGIAIKNCTDVMIIGGTILPVGYQVVDQPIPSDQMATCTLSGFGMTRIKFEAIGVS